MSGIRLTAADLARLGYKEKNGRFVRKNVQKVSGTGTKISKTVNKIHNPDLFVLMVRTALQVEVIPEYRFDPKRKWRFDYAIPSEMVAIEVEGGIWTNGRHTRGYGYRNDMDKYNRANALGWRLIRVTPKGLMTSGTLDMIKKYIEDNTHLWNF